MRIENIRFKHHKVLGDTYINLCGKKRKLSHNKQLNNDDMIMELSNPSHNTFTYLIGENGVGKSILFRSIVDYSNAFERSLNEKRINEFNRLIEVDNGLNTYRGFNELFYDFDIWNFFHSKQFLEKNDMFLAYVSSTIIEGDVFGSSERFSEISFSRSIQTKIMLAKAFRKNSDESRNILLHYINKSNNIWEQKLVISNHGWDDNEATLAIKNGISLMNILKLFDCLQDCKYDTNYLDSDSLQVLRFFLSTKSFIKFFMDPDCDKKINQILMNFYDTNMFRQMKSVLSSFSHESHVLGSRFSMGAIGINFKFIDGKRTSPLLKEKFDIKELEEIECLFMLILVEMGLLDYDITCGGVPVERMSSGEQMLIRLYALFANLPQNFEKSNIVLLFDEPELSLHPKWQQQFPEYFRIVAEDIYNITSSHFIFATHSPLIIMKSFFNGRDVNVVKIYKDGNTTKSMRIKDVYRYSIEELLMDNFSLEYRHPQKDLKLQEILDCENNRRLDDRSNCILQYDELRKEIDRLYNDMTQKEK